MHCTTNTKEARGNKKGQGFFIYLETDTCTTYKAWIILPVHILFPVTICLYYWLNVMNMTCIFTDPNNVLYFTKKIVHSQSWKKNGLSYQL